MPFAPAAPSAEVDTRPAGLNPGSAVASPGLGVGVGLAALVTGCSTVSPLDPATARAIEAPSVHQAARFLAQAGFAATPALIEQVQAGGCAAWIDRQLQLPRTQGHLDWMLEQGYGQPQHRNGFAGADNTLWRKLIASPDVLRQRVALALSEIFVVSMQGLNVPWRGLVTAHYMDLLEAHAFGDYRQLLEAVTLSPAMGVYLNMRGNRRGDPATGRMPDENYAREILQLFSIGLVELHEDGTPRTDWRGQPRETYGQDTVTGLARVFTGWNLDRYDRDRHDWVSRPMSFTAARHEPGDKRFLGLHLPAGTPGPEALTRTLDHIAAHPNVGPFIGRQLIQRLVTSNPSPAYVRRVARVFADNGQGARGDLGAVVRAVLLDPDARRDPNPADRQSGRLREPLERFIQWARTFGAASNNGQWAIGATLNPANRLAQSPLRSPSVFNFFRPGYVPPGTAMADRALQAPEFQLVHETSVAGWVNFSQQFVVSGVADVRPEYEREVALAHDAPALVDHLDRLLTGGQLSPHTRGLIARAVATVPAPNPAGRRNRVCAALHLCLCSPQYLVTA